VKNGWGWNTSLRGLQCRRRVYLTRGDFYGNIHLQVCGHIFYFVSVWHHPARPAWFVWQPGIAWSVLTAYKMGSFRNLHFSSDIVLFFAIAFSKTNLTYLINFGVSHLNKSTHFCDNIMSIIFFGKSNIFHVVGFRFNQNDSTEIRLSD